MGYWEVIVPQATTNHLLDPQFGLADPDTVWDIAGDGLAPDVVRDTTRQWAGTGCARCDVDTGSYVLLTQAVTVTATVWTLSCRVRRSGGGELTDAQCQAVFDLPTVGAAWDSITALGDGWYVCVKSGTPTAGSRTFGVKALEDDLYVDGMQLENLAYATTYCDGEQAGCAWSVARHTSTSSRDAGSRDGGRQVNLDTYGAYVTKVTGIGMPKVAHATQSYALLPGSEYAGTKVQERSAVIAMQVMGSSRANLHALRAALIDALKPDLTTQPGFWLVYTAAAVQKRLWCLYEAGLEQGVTSGFSETLAMRVLCPDPAWYAFAQAATIATPYDSGTLVSVAWRHDGVTQPLEAPSSGGTVWAIVAGADGTVYVGGDFDNWNGIVNADNVVALVEGEWAALGTGVDDTVRALAIGPDGTLYAGGAFHNAGGGAAAHVAKWNGSAWSALGAGVDDDVHALAVGHDGALYAAGLFENAGGGAAAFVAKWDGSAWSALGAGLDSSGEALAVGLDGAMYCGGTFTAAGGSPANYVAAWDGSSWTALGGGLEDTAWDVAVGPDGRLYAAGSFEEAGGNAAAYVATWNGSAWSALGDGLSHVAYCLAVGPDGSVYVGGAFTSAGGIALTERIARWNGSSWSHLSLDLPGTPPCYAIAIGRRHAVVERFYDVFFGFSSAASGTAYYAVSATVTNSGSMTAYPVITVARDGGDAATLQSILNQTSGQEILLDLALLDGETVTLDLRPGKKTITSTFRGNRLGDALPGSDLATWGLLPGDNAIYVFVGGGSGIAVTVTMQWDRSYWSAD